MAVPADNGPSVRGDQYFAKERGQQVFQFPATRIEQREKRFEWHNFSVPGVPSSKPEVMTRPQSPLSLLGPLAQTVIAHTKESYIVA